MEWENGFATGEQTWSIIDSTLREGEQFAGCRYTSEQKVEIAKMLSRFGVEYVELTSPAASLQSRADLAAVAALGLEAKVLTHVRCHMTDVQLAVGAGVDGVNVSMGTSSLLRDFSHRKDIDFVIERAKEVVNYVKSEGVEVRFSCEDSFRSSQTDLFKIYSAVDRLGVDRVGVADTVGVARPRQVFELVRSLRSLVGCGIEFHGHNDTGCAIANSYSALEAGATHVDTTVLGLGERNGITPLGGFVARMYADNAAEAKRRYRLRDLPQIEAYVAGVAGVQVPFNNCITGSSAFTHKAGIHVKALLNNPSTYEILNPEDFGVARNVDIAHRLTGWNAINGRAKQLGLSLDEERVKAATRKVKDLADRRAATMQDVDEVLRAEAALATAIKEPVDSIPPSFRAVS